MVENFNILDNYFIAYEEKKKNNTKLDTILRVFDFNSLNSVKLLHGVQRRMISVDNFFVFLR